MLLGGFGEAESVVLWLGVLRLMVRLGGRSKPWYCARRAADSRFGSVDIESIWKGLQDGALALANDRGGHSHLSRRGCVSVHETWRSGVVHRTSSTGCIGLGF